MTIISVDAVGSRVKMAVIGGYGTPGAIVPELFFEKKQSYSSFAAVAQSSVNETVFSFMKDFKGCGVWLICRGLPQGPVVEIDNKVPLVYYLRRSNESQDASVRIEMGNVGNTGISVLAAGLFLLGTVAGEYTLVECISGTAWVFLLLMIILMPVVTPLVKRRVS